MKCIVVACGLAVYATGEMRADAPLALDGMRGFPKAQSAADFLPFVDRYGQFVHDDWPGKIHDDAELAASRKAEEAWLEEHPCPVPDADMFHPGLFATGSQAERAERYRRYVEACLDSPRYVGAHWFQWQDQPLTGRPDGENFAIGLVSVADAHYPELVQAVQTTAAEMYRRRSSAVNEQPRGVLRK